MRRRAVTIVEVLVVIGVVLLLSGLLVPSVRGARRVARQSVCLRQMGSHSGVMAAYAADHDDKWPLSVRETRAGDGLTFVDGRAAPANLRYEDAAGMWPVAVLEAYGERAFAESLICPEDRLTKVIVAAAAERRGAPPESERDVRGTIGYWLSVAMLLDPRALDPESPSAGEEHHRVQTHAAVVTPSLKAALAELEPMHDPKFAGGETRTFVGVAYARNVVGADGAAKTRKSDGLTPGVVMGPAADEEERLRLAEAGKLMRTPWGVRGRDW